MSIQPKFVAATDGDRWRVLGQQVRGVLLSEQTGGRMAVCEIIAPAGDEVPLHVHRNEDESFYILDGQLEVCCDRTWMTLKVGDTTFLPRGTPHTFRNTSSQPCRFLVVITPGGFEGFFRDLSGLAEQGSVGPDVAAQTAAKYGLEFLAG